MRAGAVSSRKSLKRYGDVLLALTQKELRVRYKSYVLGYLWSLGQPLAFAGIFYFAFKVAMKVPTEDYLVFLLAGLFPWQWISNSINVSPLMFLMNASIIKKVSFPRSAVVLSIVIQDGLHFMLSLPILATIGYFYGYRPTLHWLVQVPLLLVLQLMFLTGVSLAMASMNVFFRDLERLTTLLMTMIFYFTPIVYSVKQLPEHIRSLLVLNPIAIYTMAWRSLLLGGSVDAMLLLWAVVHGSMALLIGGLLYRRLQSKFAEVL